MLPTYRPHSSALKNPSVIRNENIRRNKYEDAPVGHESGGADDQRRRTFWTVIVVCCHGTQGLDRLSQSHVITQGSMKVKLIQEPQPADTLDLVSSQSYRDLEGDLECSEL